MSDTDLDKKADALPITPEQYTEIPELTDQWFEQAELTIPERSTNGVVTQPGKPNVRHR